MFPMHYPFGRTDRQLAAITRKPYVITRTTVERDQRDAVCAIRTRIVARFRTEGQADAACARRPYDEDGETLYGVWHVRIDASDPLRGAMLVLMDTPRRLARAAAQNAAHWNEYTQRCDANPDECLF